MSSANGFLPLSPRDAGLSEEISQDIERLNELLGTVLLEQTGETCLDVARRLYHESPTLQSDSLFDQYPELRNPDTVLKVLRAYTVLFRLINLAEQKEIIRVNRFRQTQSKTRARTESIQATIQELHQRGVDADGMRNLLGRLDISPTLTAHPTEARRRAVLDHLETLAVLLVESVEPSELPELNSPLNRGEQISEELYRGLTSMWLTDDLSAGPVTVQSEARNAMYYMEHSIMDVVAWLHDDLERALNDAYPGETFDIPPFIRYRTWVGGDRDGNPNVTPEISWSTLVYQKEKIIRYYSLQVSLMMKQFTQSRRLAPPSEKLLQSLNQDRKDIRTHSSKWASAISEPYRLKLMMMRTRLNASLRALRSCRNFHTLGDAVDQGTVAYADSKQFLDDLELIHDSLCAGNASALAKQGSLKQLMVKVKTFGFHLATMDMRQHSKVHEQILNELFSQALMLPDGKSYAQMSEDEKVELLTQELNHPRPLLSRESTYSERVQNGLGVFQVMRMARNVLSEESVNTYIISMTHSISDVLEVLVLAKEEGLIRWKNDPTGLLIESDLDVVPLFETIDDLNDCDSLLRKLFVNPTYTRQLAARKQFQEVMLGYSDSSKDGGYVAANWNLYDAQSRISALSQETNITIRMFHGRGGTVGRGGGRSYQAITGQPAGSLDGAIRFTEQGEVISFRYSFPPLAHRHLEQIVSAVMIKAAHVGISSAVKPEWLDCMKFTAEHSRQAYRDLVYNDPDFWAFYVSATPIAQISRLPIASRPVFRSAGTMAGMEDLRAIPWVFSWVQNRYMIPGWYGVGIALDSFMKKDERNAAMLQEMYENWTFFHMLIDNAQLELMRAHLPTARWYTERMNEAELGERIHTVIKEEYELTRRCILEIVQADDLLELSPVVRKTIELRNPAVAPLNRLQVALLAICQKAEEQGEDDGPWREAVLQSIAGLAAAMQSTG